MIWLLLTLWVLVVGLAAGCLLKKRFRWLGWGVILATLLAVGLVAAGMAICWDAPENEEGLEADYGLLLGCALEHGQATDEMVRRCETALNWMQENPHRYLVASGGDPGGQGRTEAAVMAAWLRNHGAKPDRILIEDQARDTRENLRYSKTILQQMQQQTDTVAIITSEYHQTRAGFLARQNGQQALHISCETPVMAHLFAAVREVYSFVKALWQTA